ncbi:MAG: hypothetical protein V3W44_10230 [Dehalococcoidales bacterium]
MSTTPLYSIELITQGEVQAEVVANQGLVDLEAAMSQTNTFDAAGTGSITFDISEAINMFTSFTGVITTDKTAVIPAVSKFYVFTNDTTGDFDFFVGVSGGVQLKLISGEKTHVYCDGVDTFDFRLLLDSRVRSVTEAAELEPYDNILFCDTTGGAFSVTLPSTVPIGQRFLIVSVGSTNTLTLDRNSNTINGAAADVTITTDQQAIELIGNTATNWLAYRTTLA